MCHAIDSTKPMGTTNMSMQSSSASMMKGGMDEGFILIYECEMMIFYHYDILAPLLYCNCCVKTWGCIVVEF
jgi:hypothetical protein